jgi:predicted transcriptional regulator
LEIKISHQIKFQGAFSIFNKIIEKLIERKEKLMKIIDKLMEIIDKLMEIIDTLMEIIDKLMEMKKMENPHKINQCSEQKIIQKIVR